MRKPILLLSCILILSFVFSAQPLTEYGFNGIQISGSEQKECFSFSVDYTQKESIFEEGILSIRAEFIGKDSDNSYLLAKINGAEKIIWPEYFSCEDECWARVYIPELKYSKTDIQLCLITGGGTQKAEIFSDSTIGLYSSPIIKITNVAPSEIFLGQRAKLQTTIKNIGSKEADLFVQFVGEDTRAVVKISSFDIVEGDAQSTTTIKPGETKIFEYYIKPTLISSYNLPASTLTFTNVFGEKQRILSNHPKLSVVDPERTNIIIISEGLDEDIFNFKIKVSNNWPDTFNGKLQILPEDLVEKSIVDILVPGKGEKEFSFSTSKLLPGNYSISATIYDGNNAASTESVSFEVTKQDFMFEVILAIIGGIIALAIFAGIYFIEN